MAESYAEVASKGPKQAPEEAAAPQQPEVEPNITAPNPGAEAAAFLASSTTTTGAATGTESSTLIDVDGPSVRAVPADFPSQPVKTETQAMRIDVEAEQQELAAEAASDRAKKERKEKNKEKEKGKKKRQEEVSQKEEEKKVQKEEQAEEEEQIVEAVPPSVEGENGWMKSCRYWRETVGLGRPGAVRAMAVINLAAVVGLSGWLGYRAWGLYDRGRLSSKEVGLGLGVIGITGVVESLWVSYLQKSRKIDP